MLSEFLKEHFIKKKATYACKRVDEDGINEKFMSLLRGNS
jgi:hypothetical protein